MSTAAAGERGSDLTTAEVMIRLNVGKQAVYALASAGRLKSYKLLRERRYTAESVETLRNGGVPVNVSELAQEPPAPPDPPRRRRGARPEWMRGVVPVMRR